VKVVKVREEDGMGKRSYLILVSESVRIYTLADTRALDYKAQLRGIIQNLPYKLKL